MANATRGRYPSMCKLYSNTSNVQAIIDLVRAARSLAGDLPP